MIDYRLKTFLSLCKTMNYTKTAKELHMTQPAVTQHVQYLEDYYKNKLFIYENRKLELTRAGERLYRYSIGLRASTDRFNREIKESRTISKKINFGATLTIGEYIMPRLLIDLEKDEPDIDISMRVFNTERLLEELELGNIDFALVEGHFNKKNYDYYLFSEEEFIGISSSNKFDRKLKLDDLYGERLILRERGSGTREIFEQILYEKNLNISNFNRLSQIGNMNAIKEMVREDMGISFLYEKAVRKELEEGSLTRLDIDGFKISREFNFIFLKNNLYQDEYSFWYKYFLNSFKRLF